MLIIKSNKIVMIDCDDTLIMWDKSKYKGKLEPVTIKINKFKSVVYKNQKNINLIIKLKKLGYTLIVWSLSGYEWAQKVTKAVGLENYVTICMSKPNYYVDDSEVKNWIGHRLWRDPLNGLEQN